MRAELAGRVDQISALHSELYQKQLEVSTTLSPCSRLVVAVSSSLELVFFIYQGQGFLIGSGLKPFSLVSLSMQCRSHWGLKLAFLVGESGSSSSFCALSGETRHIELRQSF